jgi:F-type H+-transporting ATPase subunit delta
MATQTDALAQIYAHSLYELADEAGGAEKIFEVAAELEQVCELARGDKSFAEFLASPIIDCKRRGAALGAIFRDQITDLTLRFLLVVNDKGRLAHLESMNTALDRIVQEAHGRIEVDVYTAEPVADATLETIRGRVQTALGREPVLHPYTDRSMIGGLKLRIGDQLVDGSVATRLRRVRHDMLSKGGAMVRDRIDKIVDEGGSPA